MKGVNNPSRSVKRFLAVVCLVTQYFRNCTPECKSPLIYMERVDWLQTSLWLVVFSLFQMEQNSFPLVMDEI